MGSSNSQDSGVSPHEEDVRRTQSASSSTLSSAAAAALMVQTRVDEQRALAAAQDVYGVESSPGLPSSGSAFSGDHAAGSEDGAVDLNPDDPAQVARWNKWRERKERRKDKKSAKAKGGRAAAFKQRAEQTREETVVMTPSMVAKHFLRVAAPRLKCRSIPWTTVITS